MKKKATVYLPSETRYKFLIGCEVVFNEFEHKATVTGIYRDDNSLRICFDDDSILEYTNLPFEYYEMPEESDKNDAPF